MADASSVAVSGASREEGGVEVDDGHGRWIGPGPLTGGVTSDPKGKTPAPVSIRSSPGSEPLGGVPRGTGMGLLSDPGGTADGAASEAGVEKVAGTTPIPGDEGGGGEPRAGTDAARRRSATVMLGRAAGAGLAEDALPEDGANGRDGPRSGGAGAEGGRLARRRSAKVRPDPCGWVAWTEDGPGMAGGSERPRSDISPKFWPSWAGEEPPESRSRVEREECGSGGEGTAGSGGDGGCDGSEPTSISRAATPSAALGGKGTWPPSASPEGDVGMACEPKLGNQERTVEAMCPHRD